MSDDARTLYALVGVLLLAMAALLYLSWMTRGEVDFLHERVDSIDMRPVARILRARDDETAEAVAREG